jgi:MFS family permease
MSTPPHSPLPQRLPVVLKLGVAQTLAWASSYYLPAILATPIARDLGLGVPTVFAAFSCALVVSAILGPHAGQAIDRWGGRPVLCVSNLVFALGLLGLALVSGPVGLFAAWLLLGVGMGLGLYEAGFATLVRLYGSDSRGVITGITLIAGFASTVGWPLSSLGESLWGWRNTCLAWAALHLLIGLPLNWTLPKATKLPIIPEPQATSTAPAQTAVLADPPPARTKAESIRISVLLSIVFAVTWFTSTAMASHLPDLLMASGASLAAAVGVGALIGPAQVAGRVLEFGLLRHVHPLLSARLASLMHPLGAITLAVLGPPAAAAFAMLHGAGNGILTIAKGTLPLALFGPQGYGQRQGWLMVPARIAQAMAPWLFGVMLTLWGSGALWITAGLGAVAFGALWLLPQQHVNSRSTP